MLTNKFSHSLVLSIVLAAGFTSTMANAQQSGGRRGPPPEAIEACVNQTVEAVCSFTSPRGNVTGQCMSAPQDPDMLACAPAGGRPKQSNNG